MNVLLTRPLAQVKTLEDLVSSSGHNPIIFPTLEVIAVDAKTQRQNYDAIIFISANAVDYGIDLLKSIDYKSAKIFAVGCATAKRLTDKGISADGFPKNKASSEALLAMDNVSQLSASNILIFRGVGGREVLKNGLISRGNIVEYAEVYERVQSPILPLHKDSINNLLSSDDGIITITSIDSMSAMLSIVEQINTNYIDVLKQYPMIVISERIKHYVNSIGFDNVKVTSKTNDNGIAQSLKSIY